VSHVPLVKHSYTGSKVYSILQPVENKVTISFLSSNIIQLLLSIVCTKSPKLYFYDTGVLSSLLGMTNAEQMATHYLRGEIFENMVIADCVKNHYAQGKTPQIYFWRDSNQNEVDLLVENGLALQAYEIKSSATINSDFLNGLKNFRQTADLPQENTAVIYGGDINFRTTSGFFVSWKKVWKND